ncbi:hypothetical protein C8Q77DRAFT_12254 [Trametes polyzona]|nr:hypothetical protein C8Q77DRAFT_12254 [Trametes polyzona]
MPAASWTQSAWMPMRSRSWMMCAWRRHGRRRPGSRDKGMKTCVLRIWDREHAPERRMDLTLGSPPDASCPRAWCRDAPWCECGAYTAGRNAESVVAIAAVRTDVDVVVDGVRESRRAMGTPRIYLRLSSRLPNSLAGRSLDGHPTGRGDGLLDDDSLAVNSQGNRLSAGATAREPEPAWALESGKDVPREIHIYNGMLCLVLS